MRALLRLCAQCAKRPAVWRMPAVPGKLKLPLCRVCAREWKRWRATRFFVVHKTRSVGPTELALRPCSGRQYTPG